MNMHEKFNIFPKLNLLISIFENYAQLLIDKIENRQYVLLYKTVKQVYMFCIIFAQERSKCIKKSFHYLVINNNI